MANINGWGRGTWGEGSWEPRYPLKYLLQTPLLLPLGTVSTVAKANVTPTGQSATGGVSGVGVNAQAVAVCPSAVGTVGSVSVLVDGEANVFPTGQAATSAVGTATTISNNNISISLGAATSALGTATTDAEANVSPTGQSATGSVGSVLVWSLIDDSQTSNFTSINEAQTPNWEDVA
jgi:hypothetical protein